MRFSNKELRSEISLLLQNCKIKTPVRKEIDIKLSDLSGSQDKSFSLKFVTALRILKEKRSILARQSTKRNFIGKFVMKYGEKSALVKKLRETRKIDESDDEEEVGDQQNNIKKGKAKVINMSEVEDKFYDLIQEHNVKFTFDDYHRYSKEFHSAFLRKQRDMPVQEY